jgi:hypothetical protein
MSGRTRKGGVRLKVLLSTWPHQKSHSFSSCAIDVDRRRGLNGADDGARLENRQSGASFGTWSQSFQTSDEA